MHDVATEIIRRVTSLDGITLPDGSRRGPYVVRLSNPPTARERLQLLAARIQRTPIAIMPPPCKSMEEWIGRYGSIEMRPS